MRFITSALCGFVIVLLIAVRVHEWQIAALENRLGARQAGQVELKAGQVWGEHWRDTSRGKNLEWLGLYRIVAVHTDTFVADEYYLSGSGASWHYTNQTEPLSYLKTFNLGELQEWPVFPDATEEELYKDRRMLGIQ